MKIYTRSGDAGQTSLIGGRVDKDDARVEAYGTIDELNSFVGTAISLMNQAGEGGYADLSADLTLVQHELFDCGSDLALARKDVAKPYKVAADMTDRLEAWIDKYDAETPDITRFILPGGTQVSSALHVCRTVCRRAERRIVTLARNEHINEEVRRYINRLSDYFFTIARLANHRAGAGDVEYVRSAEVFKQP